jgi:hypothetical protein
MPDISLDRTMPCCLPEEEFLMVGDHEIEEMHRYRGLALSFLHCHPCISRVMVALGIECEQRLDNLAAVADRLQLVRDLKSREINGSLMAKLNRHHFFVVHDNNMAWLTLAQAWAAACNSWHSIN